ncbi:MAG: methyltransferase [Sandaracinus sp.]|nr:methyltransferase [Sandaracinus sp.]|tara:strand:+ start:159 stop:470 length:312 start_codon:yes stop_codon:yes gene_type:complete
MSAFEPVYAIVRTIPPGRVMTYGQIAKGLERPLSPKAVGWAMSQCPDDVPWHRVVDAKGTCSRDRADPSGRQTQRRRLEREGVAFDAKGRLDLEALRFHPPRG